MYHYVYRITNKVLNQHYYGKRSSKLPPQQDLGKRYFSSSKDKEFKQDQRTYPGNYKYKIIRICASSQEALLLEIALHNRFNVKANPKFYNRSNQTVTKFTTTGRVTVKDTLGNTFSILADDERLLKKELVGINKGYKHSATTKQTISQAHLGKKHSQNHRDNIRAAKKGKPINISPASLKALEENRYKAYTEEARLKISSALKGRKFTEIHKQRLSESQKGKAKPCTKTPEQLKAHGDKLAKLADIYDAATNMLIAENVVIRRWAKLFNYDAPQLGKTTRRDLAQPPSKTNVYSHKGIYAIYKDSNEINTKRKFKTP